MPSLADSLLSSSARPLGLRMRPDLTAHQQRYQGRLYWVVKDPIGLNYFRFQEEEFALLKMLDGLSSLDDLKSGFEEMFAPQQISVEELGQFVGMLHRSNLVIADMPGQGRQLLKRRGERKRQEWLAALSNVLAIRFKGIDPERILNWIYPKVSWFFTRTALIICVLFALSALLLVAVQFDVFWSKLPSFHQFFAKGNWLWLAVAVAVTKVCHEFGHGLSCKHFGGECHELGFMMLVLTPCLYCNVSDSWMLPSKWNRASIGAAGMYVELVIASFATYIWWFSEPGFVNEMALNVMFVCSVSTVIFNANPLLRYDGYYILSDLSEIPNLRQKATTILSRKLGAWCLGMEEPEDPFLPQRNQVFFALYSVASAVYSWFITFSILMFLQKVFEPYRLEIIGHIIGLAAIGGLVLRPLWKLGHFFWIPGRLEQVKKERLRISLAVIGTAILAFLFLPLPYRFVCTLNVEARDAKTVYVEVPGSLVELKVQPGQQVKKGDLLARLENMDLKIAQADLSSKRSQYDAQLRSLQRERHKDPQAGLEIPHIQDSLRAITEQLAEKERALAQLELRAPIDGWVIPPTPVPQPQTDDNERLPSWWGTPLEKRNIGAFLKPGMPFCQIGDPTKMQAALVIDQADVDLVAPRVGDQPGSKVVVKLDELPGDTFTTDVIEISRKDMSVSPREMSHKTGGELQTKTDPTTGVERPLSASYQAVAPLDDEDQVLMVGLRGRAKVSSTRWISLGGRVWRWFGQTFHFRM
jgi:putative peptide zinc metalloprotease protein